MRRDRPFSHNLPDNGQLALHLRAIRPGPHGFPVGLPATTESVTKVRRGRIATVASGASTRESGLSPLVGFLPGSLRKAARTHASSCSWRPPEANESDCSHTNDLSDDSELGHLRHIRTEVNKHRTRGGPTSETTHPYFVG